MKIGNLVELYNKCPIDTLYSKYVNHCRSNPDREECRSCLLSKVVLEDYLEYSFTACDLIGELIDFARWKRVYKDTPEIVWRYQKGSK